MYNLGSTLSAGHLTRVCKSMSDCLCLLGSTNTQTLSYSHSSSWAWVTPCDTLCDYRFLLAGFAHHHWKSMGELLDYEPSLPQKNEFFERRRMALGINSICTMFTPFRNEQRAFVHEIHEQRNFYEHREFVQKHELGYVRVEHVREMISRYHVLPRARIPTSCVQGSVI